MQITKGENMIRKEISIKTEFIKLDQFLKFVGIAETGGHSKEIVKEGACKVNGEVCTQRGKKLRVGDIIQIDEYELTII